jgi:hypothetical protein
VQVLDHSVIRLRLKCDGTRAETRFRLSAKRTSPFKSAGASVQSTTGSRGVRISCSNAGYTMFRGSVKGTGYPTPFASFPFTSPPNIAMCHHISTGLYKHSKCGHMQLNNAAGKTAYKLKPENPSRQGSAMPVSPLSVASVV